MTEPALLFTADAHGEGAVMVVKDIYGKVTDTTITLAGIHSKAWREKMSERDRMTIASGGRVTIPPEDMFAAITLGWENMPDPRQDTLGEPLEFSQENARMIYEKAPSIVDQVDRFIANHANFMKGSASE